MAALEAVLEHWRAQRDRALTTCLQARQRLAAASAQAQQLRGYRDEHASRWLDRLRVGATAPLVRTAHQFGHRLDEAVVQQAATLEDLRSALSRAEADLAHQELKLASVRKLIERRLHEHRVASMRREQRAADDRRPPTQRDPFAATSVS